MKVIVLGDVHIGARNDSQVFADYHISFFTEQLFPYMKKHKIKHIIQLGDIFDRRKFVNFVVLNQWKTKVFDYMQAEKITMDVLLGNHDVYFRNTNDVSSPVLLLREYYNINVFVEPTDVTIGTSKFMYIPWINSSNLESTLEKVKASEAIAAFGHFEFAGFQMDKGQKHEDGLSTKDFKKFDSVYSGHFHHRNDDGHVFYVGTPYQITWVDHESTKGFHVFDTSTLEMTFIENPNLLFHRMVYDDQLDPDNHYKSFDLSGLAGKYVKIIVSSKTNLYGFDQLLSKLYAQGPADVKIIENVQEQEQSGEKLDLESTKEILDKAVDSLDNVLDKKVLKKMLRTLYTEAQQMEVV